MPTAAARRSRVGPLYELLVGVNTIEEFLTDLTHVASDEIDRELSCGLTAQVEGKPITITSSDDLAAALDNVQYTSGEGPCLTAIATVTTVEVTDPHEADNWTAWQHEAIERGLRKSLSVPLTTASGHTLGALNLYSRSTAKFTDADRDAAALFAAQAAGALAVAIRLAQLAELTGHLQLALESRGIIDQAKGILMGQEHCTADEAFALLRTASQHRNTKVRDIATEIVNRVSERRERPTTGT